MTAHDRHVEKIATRTGTWFILGTALTVIVLVIWANNFSINKITRSSGQIVAKANNQRVQHFEGGIVEEILVREGDKVRKNDVLLRLSNRFSSAEDDNTAIELAATRMKIWRLDAEIAGRNALVPPPDLNARSRIYSQNELAVFERRRDALHEQALILQDELRKLKAELSGKQDRKSFKESELALVKEQLDSIERLYQQGAVSRNEWLDQRANWEQIMSQHSDLGHQIDQSKAEINRIKRREREMMLTFRSEAETERAKAVLHLGKLEKMLSAVRDRTERGDVRAPTDGTINKLNVTTVGGVVQPGQILAEIVPADHAIAVDARLLPRDRANIWPGLTSIIKVSAYDYTIYGALEGKIVDVSPDALKDEQGQLYFRMRIEAAADGFGPSLPVVPGMLASVDVITGQHTVMEYLLRPLRHMRERALQ